MIKVTNLNNLYFQPGITFEAKSGINVPGLNYSQLFARALKEIAGIPSLNDCCNPITITNGQVLAYSSATNNFIPTTISGGGGGGISNVSLGTLTSTNNQIVVTGGSNFNLSAATNSTAGLITAAQFNQLSTLPASFPVIANNNVLFGNGTNVPTSSTDLTWNNTTKDFTINGKLTVTGLIDPTGLQLVPQGTNPGIIPIDTVWLNSTNNHLMRGSVDIEAITSGGTVSSVAFASNTATNGIVATVATSTTTPLITLGTSVSGLVKGSAGAFSAAVAGTDYLSVLSGDVVTLNNVATIQSNSVTNSKLAQAPANTILGNSTGSVSNVQSLTNTQVKTLLDINVTDIATSLTGVLHATGSALITSAVLLNSEVSGVLPVVNGGTNLNSFSAGDMIYASATNVLSKLAVGTTGQILNISNGFPSWTNASSTVPSKYNVAVTASAGMTCRVFGSAGITVVKTNASTVTFTIPVNGYITNHDLYFPSAENPGANITFIYNYISNTLTNQDVLTADVPSYKGFFVSTLPLSVYTSGQVGSASIMAESIIGVSSGNLSVQLQLGTTSLSSGAIVIKGNF